MWNKIVAVYSMFAESMDRRNVSNSGSILLPISDAVTKDAHLTTRDLRNLTNPLFVEIRLNDFTEISRSSAEFLTDFLLNK